MEKLIFVTRHYNSCLDYLYKKHNFSKLSYERHLNTIMREKISWSDYLSVIFKNIKVINVIINDNNLQKKWLKYHNIKTINKNILETQIEKIKPKYILFNNIRDFNKNINFCKKNKILTLFFDGIGTNNLINEKPNGVITCLKYSKKFYEKNNIPCLYLPHGYDNRLKIKNNKIYDVTFIGNVSSIKHVDRSIFLYEVSKKIKLNIWISETPSILKTIIIFLYLVFFKPNKLIKYLLSLNFINKNNNGPIYGIDMYKIISKSKIVINYHIETAKNESANMRMFEVTGIGSCLATEYKNNLNKFFDTKTEIIKFKNLNELCKKIKYLLNNETKLQKISQKGQKKTLKYHNLNLRFIELENFIKFIKKSGENLYC